MSDPSPRAAARVPSPADQVADVIVLAAQLFGATTDSGHAVGEFVAALRVAGGVHTVHRDDDAESSESSESSSGGARLRHLLVGPFLGLGRPSIAVELAGPRDRSWAGAEQRRRLHAALSMVEHLGSHQPGYQSEQLLRHARSVVVQLSRTSWVVRSDALRGVLGYPPDIVSRHRPLSFVDPRDRDTAIRAYLDTRSGRCSNRMVDLRVRAADGNHRVLETSFVRLVATGEPDAVVAYGLDVTEQRADRARLSELVMRLSGGVLVVDEGELVRLANDAFTRMFGTRTGGWRQQHQRTALHAVASVCLDTAGTRTGLRAITGAATRRTLRLSTADGRVIDVDRVPLAERGLDLGCLWHFRDVTAEVAGRASGDREAVLAEQDRVLATVSHELRTPLTAVSSFVELLADPVTGSLNDDQRAAIDVIARNTSRLLTLVDDFLLLARLEHGQVPLRVGEVDVPVLVANVVRDRRPEAAESGITLSGTAESGPVLSGDGSRLQQVLDNLVHNAVKFSPARGAVAVSAVHRADSWVVTVRDDGIGIPPDELASVTGGFQRGSNAVSGGIPGSGLGLAVCRQVVELHHGTLAIDSVLNQGTTVRVVLPERRGDQ